MYGGVCGASVARICIFSSKDFFTGFGCEYFGKILTEQWQEHQVGGLSTKPYKIKQSL